MSARDWTVYHQHQAEQPFSGDAFYVSGRGIRPRDSLWVFLGDRNAKQDRFAFAGEFEVISRTEGAFRFGGKLFEAELKLRKVNAPAAPVALDRNAIESVTGKSWSAFRSAHMGQLGARPATNALIGHLRSLGGGQA